jgi:N utilization substance protein B
MSSRRKVREAVVQFLYAAGAGHDPLPAADSPHLGLLYQPMEEKITRSRARSAVHLQQGRGKCIDTLEQLVQRLAQVELRGDPETSLTPLRELWTAETDLRDTIESTQRELNGNKDAGRLGDLLNEARACNQKSRSAAARLHDTRPDFPALASIREDTLPLIGKLSVYSERLEAAVGEDTEDLPELAATRKQQAELDKFRAAVVTYIDGIGGHLTSIDRLIESSVENYAPDRINRTDRAVLRLATYELTQTPDVPPAVAINEAIELAREFGTTDSPRFVNGILDRIRSRSTEQI